MRGMNVNFDLIIKNFFSVLSQIAKCNSTLQYTLIRVANDIQCTCTCNLYVYLSVWVMGDCVGVAVVFRARLSCTLII